MRTISILGSTGSIGTQTLEVVEVLGEKTSHWQIRKHWFPQVSW